MPSAVGASISSLLGKTYPAREAGEAMIPMKCASFGPCSTSTVPGNWLLVALPNATRAP